MHEMVGGHKQKNGYTEESYGYDEKYFFTQGHT